MTNTRKILCFLSAVLIALPASAATTNPFGGSGNLTSQSADILSRYEMISYGIVGLDDFYASGEWQHEIQILSGVYMGLSDNLEAGFGLSLANNSATIATGTSLRYFNVHGKYRFFGSRAAGRAAALSMYSTTGEVPDASALTSGNSSSGFELIYSKYRPGVDTHYALTMDTRDYKVYSASSFTYTTAPILALSASRMMYTRTHRIYELGLKAQSATVSGARSNNLYLTLAAHFNPKDAMKYSAGAILDTVDGTGVLKARYFVGFQYSSHYSDRPRAAMEEMSRPPETPKQAETPKQPEMTATEPAQAEPMQVPPAPETASACKARVEVMDMSGIVGLGQRVAGELQKEGYCITGVHLESNSMSYYSQLYYAKKQETFAKEITEHFNIQGQVSQRNLPVDVDIRFIVGRDRQ